LEITGVDSRCSYCCFIENFFIAAVLVRLETEVIIRVNVGIMQPFN
jgi:hypothetical protein